MADAEGGAGGKRSTGTVKWFSAQKGFGFIAPDDGAEDLFVHQTSIRSDGFRTLSEGQPVEFAVDMGEDGRTKAVDVFGVSRSRRTPRGGRRGFFGGRGRRGGGGAFEQGGAFERGGRSGNGGRYGGGNGGGACYNCGRFGHLARDCYQGAGGGGGGGRGGGSRRYGGGGGGGGGGGCYHCGEVGHFARDCTNVDQIQK